MILWIIFAGMAAIVAGAVLYALRPGVGAARNSRPDVDVYKDQLAALDDELESGLLEASEAKTARVEISRRLLAASKPDSDASIGNENTTNRRFLAIACSLVVVAISLGAYLMSGSPNLPDQPFAGRSVAPPEGQDMVTLIGRMEAHLAENPGDGRGWDLIAPIYLRMGRSAEAAKAFAQAMQADGETEPRLAGLGEALVQSNNGNVTEEARTAFARALALDPNALRPKFFLIVAQEQDGALSAAIDSWRALLQEAPVDIPWRSAVSQRITMLEARQGGASIPSANQSATPGPSDDQVREAGERTPEERQQMIEGMVAQLADRLAEDGDDIEGWLRLVRSYAVLGQTDKAKVALKNARTQFAQDEASLKRLAELAASGGLEQPKSE